MRIGFLATEYVTERYFSGGLANYLHRVATALVRRGHEVHILLMVNRDKPTLEREGVFVHRVAPRWLLPGRLNGRIRRLLPFATSYLGYSSGLYRRLSEMHRSRPFDILQSTNLWASGLISMLLLRVPHVLRCSSYERFWRKMRGERRTVDARICEWIEWLQLRVSRHLFVPSYALRDLITRETGVRRITVIRSPFYLETAKWNLSVYDKHVKGRPYLLFFGRFELHKGFHILSRALPEFLHAHADARAVLVGKDRATPLASSMAEYARAACARHADRLIILDALRHEELYPIIAHARLVVLPSLIDNLPNACLEAMGLGKPVLGTIGTSLDELTTEGETGFLVLPGDVEALAAKMIEAWRCPRLEEMGRAAQARIDEFAPERTIGKLEQYYREVLKNSRT